MNAKLRIRCRGNQVEEKEYGISAAAQELGVSAETLRNLEKRGVVRPRRIERAGVAPLRLYREADLQRVLSHYARVGGVRVLGKR